MPKAYLEASDSFLQGTRIFEDVVCSDARLLAERTLQQVRRTGKAPIVLSSSLLTSNWDCVKA